MDCFVSRGSISPCEYFLTVFFYGEALLAPRPTPKLEDHPSSAVRGCLFNLFTATLHTGGRSSIRNSRTRHAVVTGTHIHGINALLSTIIPPNQKLRVLYGILPHVILGTKGPHERVSPGKQVWASLYSVKLKGTTLRCPPMAQTHHSGFYICEPAPKLKLEDTNGTVV